MAGAGEKTFVTRAQQEAAEQSRAAAAARIDAMARAADILHPVGVHLWPSAPRLDAVRSNHPSCWRYLWCSPAEAVQRVLTRLERAPQMVEVRAHGADTDLIGTHDAAWTVAEAEPGADPVVITDGVMMPLATFFCGVTTTQIEAAHVDLINDGWRPPVKQQPQGEKAA